MRLYNGFGTKCEGGTNSFYVLGIASLKGGRDTCNTLRGVRLLTVFEAIMSMLTFGLLIVQLINLVILLVLEQKK